MQLQLATFSKDLRAVKSENEDDDDTSMRAISRNMEEMSVHIQGLANMNNTNQNNKQYEKNNQRLYYKEFIVKHQASDCWMNPLNKDNQNKSDMRGEQNNYRRNRFRSKGRRSFRSRGTR